MHRGWPIATAALAVLSAASLPLFLDDPPLLAGVAVAALVLAIASHRLRRAVALDLTGLAPRAYTVPPHPVPEPLAVPKPWRGAWSIAAPALVPAFWGLYYFDLTRRNAGDDDAASWTFAVVAWTAALAVLGFAMAWPFRLRRAARTAAAPIDLVAWTEWQQGYPWLLVAPAGSTALADVVGIPVRKGTYLPDAFAGTVYVHGRLAPWRVAVVRAPDGTAYWPRGACHGSTWLAAKHVDAQPGA